MNLKPGMIERAYELARTGRYPSPREVAKQLTSEGFEGVQQHLSADGMLRRDVRRLCNAAKVQV